MSDQKKRLPLAERQLPEACNAIGSAQAKTDRDKRVTKVMEGEFVEPDYPTPDEADVVDFMQHKPKHRRTT